MAARILGCLVLLGAACSAPAQKLLLDRGAFQAGTALPGTFVGVENRDQAYRTDTFRIGKTGEIFVVDHIRVWGATEPRTDSRDAEDVFDTVALYGGIAPAKSSEKGADCACHGPVRLKSASFDVSNHSLRDSDVAIARVGPLWQIDFQNLRWSIPGGVDIQFGVMATGQKSAGESKNFVWKTFAAQSASTQVFVQVWGHLPANVKIERFGDDFRAILHGGPGLALSQVDVSSFRFGPSGAPPLSTPQMSTDGAREPILVVSFQASKAGIFAGTVSSCLEGRLRDATPFEGCDLVRK